mgnify:CR=1 FL=1
MYRRDHKDMTTEDLYTLIGKISEMYLENSISDVAGLANKYRTNQE